MAPCHENVLRITVALWGESTADLWIPLKKGRLCGTFSCFFNAGREKSVKQIV